MSADLTKSNSQLQLIDVDLEQMLQASNQFVTFVHGNMSALGTLDYARLFL